MRTNNFKIKEMILMEDTAEYIVKGRPRQPKLEKTIIYVEKEELDKIRKTAGYFNQKTKEGGVSGKIRELIKLYNRNSEKFDSIIKESDNIAES
jgi:endonuclease III-like uncharacterized protein